MKQSRFGITGSKLIFRENFESEQWTRKQGGEPTDVTYDNGVASFNGTSSLIEYHTQRGVKSIKFRINLASDTEDIIKLSSTHSITVSSGTISANGFVSPKIYVEGVETSNISTGWKEITITTDTSFEANDFQIGQVSSFGEFDIDLFEIYNKTLSAKEVSLLYEKSYYRKGGVNDPDSFTFKIDTTKDTDTHNFTLPLNSAYSTYSYIVNWGDGTINSLSGNTSPKHYYKNPGEYTVTIKGTFPSIYFNDGGDKLKVISVDNWGDVGWQTMEGAFYGCSNLATITNVGNQYTSAISTSGFRETFRNCTSLQTIPTDLFRYNTLVSSSGFFQTFYGCTSLTSIPTDLFRYNVNVSTSGFLGTFHNCTSLTTIPTDLFRYNVNVSSNGFYQTFRGCTSLTSIPADLFKYNTLVLSSGFYRTFYGCTSLTTIPTDLFRYNVNVSSSGFRGTFFNCTSLTSIPTDLFRYNVNVSSNGFQQTFFGCTSLTTIPTDLFKYNVNVSTSGFIQTFRSCTSLTTIPTDLFRYNVNVSTSGFLGTFANCTSLTSIPTDLFRYNVNVSSSGFFQTFYGCTKLQLNRNIFYADGEQSTRFLNQSPDFTECFSRTSFTGTQGEAPDLWDCDFGTGTPTTTGCFGGAGNDATSISNYGDIPAGWK